MKKLFLIVLLLFTLIGLGVVYWLFAYYPQQANLQSEPVELVIERGTGAAQIADKLTQDGVIKHPLAFRLYARLQGVSEKFQAGEYAFQSGITPQRVIEKLVSGDIIIRQVTLPEGKTSAEIIELLNQTPELVGKIETLPSEGSLLPNTYRYVKGETRQSVIERMQQAMQSAKTELWPQRQSDLPIKNWEEAVILASIVEKETGIASERTHVAGLYLNRLRKGMLLQADPTVAYGVYGGQYADKPLRRSDLKKDTPYNTYLHAGLPPSPICNPGKAALAAVLNPKQTDDLYMVATGTGGHYFAKTHTQHLRNVKKYRLWQRQNGRR